MYSQEEREREGIKLIFRRLASSTSAGWASRLTIREEPML
jgi:hypothetical protein